jgi:spore maturation protein CgeB
LPSLPPEHRDLDLVFVGSFHRVHKSRTELLETLCRQFSQLKIGGPTPGRLSSNSPIRQHYVGQAWGREMYRLLNRAKIVLNHHGDVPPSANNLRLFEATGMGAMLLTDWKENLAEMFDPGKEVVAYRTADECIDLAKYYLHHDQARSAVAEAGQQRTLRHHTYEQRMREFVDLVDHHL